MRIGTKWIAFALVAAFGAGIAMRAQLARAEDDKDGGAGMPVLKPVKHPLLDSVIGTWSHESTAIWGPGKGKATFALGIGGTAVIETYDSGAEAGEPTFFGHGVYRLSDDGKTLTAWWFDNGSEKPMMSTGTITEKGYDLTGEGPRGKLRQRFEKTEKGFTFTMTSGDSVIMTDTFVKSAN